VDQGRIAVSTLPRPGGHVRLAAQRAYRPRSTRSRRTRSEIETLRRALAEIVEEKAPCTVRHVFYVAALAHGLIPKTEEAYKRVIVRLLTKLRREGEIPYSSISDNTRWVIQGRTYRSPVELLRHAATTYRRSLWDAQDVRVECWCEKDAVAGIVSDVADRWCVPTMVFRGYSSVSYLHGIAEEIRAHGRPTHIYYVGDHDPSGVDIERFVRKTVREMAPEAELRFERVAVTAAQIEELGLPTRPTKQSDSRARKFSGESVEVDAMDPRHLEGLVEAAILRHLDMREIDRLRTIEEQERATFEQLAAGWGGIHG
jgi:hypothetical protein